MNKPITFIGILVAAIVVSIGAYFLGVNTGKAQAQSDQSAFLASRGFDPNNPSQGDTGTGGAGGGGGLSGGSGGAGGAGGFGGRGGGGAGRNGTVGTISKVDGNTITLTDSQGKTVTVTLTNDTPIVKSVLAKESDLSVGAHILVRGARSGDNVAASAVQITDQPNGVPSFFGGSRATATPTPGK